MSSAIGLIIILIAFGIFMPDVIRAMSTFLLAFFGKATAFLQSLPTSPAVSQ